MEVMLRKQIFTDNLRQILDLPCLGLLLDAWWVGWTCQQMGLPVHHQGFVPSNPSTMIIIAFNLLRIKKTNEKGLLSFSLMDILVKIGWKHRHIHVVKLYTTSLRYYVSILIG